MSLFDLLKNRGKSTREYIGVEQIAENYLKTKQGNQFYYFIQPTNVSVLSEDALYIKINALMTVLRGQSEIELVCLNSRENFDDNKQYLRERIKEETVPQIVKLLELDLAHYDKIQIQTVTARQFLLVIRYRDEVKYDKFSLASSEFPCITSTNKKQVFGSHLKETSSYLNQIERLIRQHGFSIKQADKSMLKQILAVYWNQNVTTEYFEDYDGERWVIWGDGK